MDAARTPKAKVESPSAQPDKEGIWQIEGSMTGSAGFACEQMSAASSFGFNRAVARAF